MRADFQVWSIITIRTSIHHRNLTPTASKNQLQITKCARPFPVPNAADPAQHAMKFSIVTALLATASLSSAWTLTWRNSNGQATVADGTKNRGCSGISHAAGQTFEWDRGWWWKDSCCVSLYRDASCGSRNGYSCDDWKKAASENIKSYKVTNC